MKKIIFVALASVMFVFTACEKDFEHMHKTFVDRTVMLNTIEDPITNVPWLQNKYLAFQEDSAYVKMRGLFIFTECGQTTQRIYEYSKMEIAGEMISTASLYNSDGSSYYKGDDCESGLSASVIAYVDDLIIDKIDMIKFTEDEDVKQKIAPINDLKVVEAIDTILNHAEITVLSCSMLQDLVE